MLVFTNVPYRMVEPNIKRILSLEIGIEIYIDNNALEGLGKNEASELGKRLQGYGISCTVHAPYMDLSPGGFDRTIRTITRDKLKRSVEMAHLLHAKGVVCHPGYDKWRFDGNERLWLDGSIETWTEVIGEAKESPLIMVENVFEENPSTLRALFEYFKEKNLWFCFDSGHFNLFSTLPLDGWLVPLKDRIKEMHLHDNHGTSDEHLPIGRGTFPFRELKAFLKHTTGILYTIEPHGEPSAEESIKNIMEFLS
jgi:sugar phosphate isomerase/epimerase